MVKLKNILKRLARITFKDLYYVYTRAYFSVFVNENAKVKICYGLCLHTKHKNLSVLG